MWVGAVAAVTVLWRLEHLTRGIKIALLTGIGFQTAYLVTDLGDGDFFLIPIADSALRWSEEIFELLAMQAYLTAVVLIVVTTVVVPRGDAGHSSKRARSEASETT